MKNIKKVYLMAGLTVLNLTGCTLQKNNSVPENSSTIITTSNQNNELPFTYEIEPATGFQYYVTSYDVERAKGTEYELNGITGSYNIKCTPAQFKQYIGGQVVTWNDIRKTISESKFDDYHKNLLLQGISNLEKEKFNIDLSVLNYNIKNTKLIYSDDFKEKSEGYFDCFEHTINIKKTISNQKHHNIVFLHEMLGHGSTEAYIPENKIYCSIDTPTYIINDGQVFGTSLFGESFTEAMAQIIAIIATGKQICKEYRSGYDLTMQELIMMCLDNNIELHEYANNGVQCLKEKLKNKEIKNYMNYIVLPTYNLEGQGKKEDIAILSDDLMYNYFKSSIDNSLKSGKSADEIIEHNTYVFNKTSDYVYTYVKKDSANSDAYVVLAEDYINLSKLYRDLCTYTRSNEKQKEFIKK
jgi:hypothetical protein